MTDFYTLWTDTGLTQLGEATLAVPFNLTTAVVGDGNGAAVIPNMGQTALVNQVWTGAISGKSRSVSDPNTIVFEFAIPATDGPFTIREVGLLDADGALCIVGNWPVTAKPVAANGAIRDMIMRVPVHFENAEVVNLVVDANVVTATREYVDAHAKDKILHGFENRLINGCFRVNQRGVSGTVALNTGEYGHDRWRAGDSGCTYTFSTVENTTTITITAGTLQQEIEGENLLTRTYVLSWVGTAQGSIDSGDFGDSGEVTAALTGGTNAVIEFGTGTLALVQLEPGAVSTSFKLRPLDIEHMLCWRYCFLLNPGSLGYSNAASTLIHISVALPVPLRATPTLSIPAANPSFDNLYAGSIYPGSGPFVKTMGTTAILLGFTVSGVVAGQVFHHTYNAVLLDSEL